MRLPVILYLIGLIISLVGASLLPEKEPYQNNSINTSDENAATNAKIDKEYISTFLSSLSFKLIVSGIVIILITIPYHLWLRRGIIAPLVATATPEPKPLKSAIRSTILVAQPDQRPTLIVKPPTPPNYRGPVIR